MHFLIPFASCPGEDCGAALRSLKLPHLQKLLARLQALPLDSGDPLSLSPPHERASARALGLPVADGLIPWAALEARQTLALGGAWGLVTPCHWRIGSQQVAMDSAALPDFSAEESQTLLAAMQPYFAEDGIALHYRQPTRWLAQSDLFDGLATAALDRVAGRDIGQWLPTDRHAAKLRRLQSEMQMLLYNHPVNEARSARGLPVVNAFWLSGTGTLAPTEGVSTAETPQSVSRLRVAALANDWAAWARAWQATDASECAELLKAIDQGIAAQLTLCGERSAQTFVPAPQGFLERLKRRFNRPSALMILEAL
jgi:hypothetical protein